LTNSWKSENKHLPHWSISKQKKKKKTCPQPSTHIHTYTNISGTSSDLRALSSWEEEKVGNMEI